MWTRKPTRIGGQTAPDDWVVCWRGQRCGRVLRVHSPATESRTAWHWSAWCDPAAHGRCEDFAEGLENVRRAVIAAGGKMSGSHPDMDLG
jgi:hypothetical protein